MPSSDWPAGSVVHFLDWRVIREGPAHCGFAGPMCYKEAGWAIPESKPASSTPWPLHQLLPSVMEYDQSCKLKKKLFLPKLPFGHSTIATETRRQSKCLFSVLAFFQDLCMYVFIRVHSIHTQLDTEGRCWLSSLVAFYLILDSLSLILPVYAPNLLCRCWGFNLWSSHFAAGTLLTAITLALRFFFPKTGFPV